jgi:hypothetical protein
MQVGLIYCKEYHVNIRKNALILSNVSKIFDDLISLVGGHLWEEGHRGGKDTGSEEARTIKTR